MFRSKTAQQILLPPEVKPKVVENEFTVHKPIEKALRDLVLKAREIEVNKKQLVNSVAFEIENELKKVNRPELICHISDVMLSALRRNKVSWSIAYLRKVLPEKYKDPTKSRNAHMRFQRAGPPGTAPDTGKTAEELQDSLNRKSVVGKYAIKYTMNIASDKPIKPIIVGKNGNAYVSMLPVIIKVDAGKQDAEASFDMERYNKILAGEKDNPVKQKIQY